MQNRIAKNYISIKGLISIALTALCILGGCKVKKAEMKDDDILRTLCKTHINFTRDGAGESDLAQNTDVIALANQNKDEILPLLIANLSNPTITESTIDDKKVVSLGCVCFDFLCTIIEANDSWYNDCVDDGFWSCVRKEYHIPITINEENITKAKEAQKRWHNLLINNELHIDLEYLKPKRTE